MGFKRQSIQKQFLMITSVFLVIIIVLVVLLIFSIKNLFLQNQQKYADMYVSRFSDELDNISFQMEVLGNDFQNSEICKELFTYGKYSDFPSSLIEEINNKVVSVKTLNPAITDVAFVNDVLHWSSIFSQEDLSTMYEYVISGSYNSRGIGLHKSSFKSLSDKAYYVYASRIYRQGKAVGCVFISFDIANIAVDSFDSQENDASSFFLMDSTGNAYALGDYPDEITDNVISFCNDNVVSDTADSDYEIRDSYSELYKDYIISINYSEKSQFYIINCLNNSAINNYLVSAWRQIVGILVVILIFSILLITVLYKNMILPINKFNSIITTMIQNNQRHLPKPIEIEGCWEILSLTNAFSTLFGAIDELNKKIFETTTKLYEEKLRGQATEISYFRSQINPHFLYNVLEQIKAMALTNNVPEIASIAIAMGKMYKYNAKGNPIVPFSSELEMTKAYIEIQKYRFKDKFEIFYNIPDEVMDIQIIKLVLQPIIENSIQHGIEPSLKNCMLYIGASVSENIFSIEIRDDGVGMTPEQLSTIQEILKKDHYQENSYVGIYNTNARLKLQYGKEYGITIDSRINEGTVVSIKIPI